MRLVKMFIIMLAILPLLVSCTKTMTLDDYAKIDMEIVQSDQKPETKEKIVKKYGFSLKQFDEMTKKVENDNSLKEKLGNKKLKSLKDIKK